MTREFKVWQRLYELCVFGFVFCGLAFSGIPGWSRLFFLFISLLAALTALDAASGRAALGKWLVFPLIFVSIAFLDGLVRYPASHDALVRFLGTWVGSLLVGDAVRRGAKIHVVINAMLFASVANASAAIAGFDAYFSYVATAEQQGYASILDRRSGLVGNANLLAIQAVLPLFAVLIWGGRVPKVLIALGIACVLYAVFSTGSRKLILLALFLLIAAWVRAPRRYRRFLLIGLGGASFVGLGMLVMGGAATGELEGVSRNVLAIDRIFQAFEGRDNSFLIRGWMIDEAQRLFGERPIIGHGLGYFADHAGFGAYAHNNYWELAAAGGLMLLASYYAMHVYVLLKAFPKAMRGNTEMRAACVLVLALLVNDYGMVTFDEKIIVLLIVLLLVWTSARVVHGMPNCKRNISSHASRPQ